jgi:hypothetical protein
VPSNSTLRFVYQDLLLAYRQAWTNIEDEQAALVNDPRRATRRNRLAAMQRAIEDEMRDLEAKTLSWAEKDFPTAYGLGGRYGAAQVGQPFVWTSTHRAAVQGAAEQVYGDLLASTQYVNTSTKRLVRRIVKDATLQKLIQSQTVTAAGRAVAALLAQHGIAAVVYADGSRRGLADYGQMVMRTSTGITYNKATITASADGGCKYWEIYDGPGCGLDSHDGQPKANGMIVGEDAAFSNPLSHPQCTRSFGPRPDLRTRADAREASLV